MHILRNNKQGNITHVHVRGKGLRKLFPPMDVAVSLSNQLSYESAMGANVQNGKA